MSLKLKVAIIVTGIFLILGIVDYNIRHHIIYPGFLSLEKEEAINNAVRIGEAFNREISFLDSLLNDWSAWDDTYEFVQSPSDQYISANLTLSTFENNQLNFIYFASKDGQVIWRGIEGLMPEEEIYLIEFIGKTIDPSHPFRAFESDKAPLEEKGISGLYFTPDGVFIVSSRPVLTSENKGPAEGTIIMGKRIDETFISRISEQIRMDLKRYDKKDEKAESVLKQAFKTGKFMYLLDIDPESNLLHIYSAIPDITGKSALILKSELQRKIVKTGDSIILYATVSFLATMISALVAMSLLIHWLVVKPVLRLKDNVIAVRKDTQKMPDLVSRDDEIGILANEFKYLFEKLDERSRILESVNLQLMDDINKRKEAEKALLEGEKQLKTVLERIPVGVFVHDHRGNYRLVNEVGCKMTGYTREELLDMNIKAIDPVEYTDQQKEMISRQFDINGSYVFESINTRKDGAPFPVEIHLTTIILNGESLLLSLALDITDRKQTEETRRMVEEQKSRSKKMESLGLMAGGVAHDLNNVLSGIVSYPELILLDLPKDSGLKKPIETIHESGKRAVAIVQDLLTVARGVAVEKEVMSLNRVVGRYLDSAENKRLMEYYPFITITGELDDNLKNIKGAPVHIGKSLMNLVFNAAEAIDEAQGKIVIKTENRYLDHSLRGYEVVKPGEYAVLSVQDSGKGIEQKDLERIFEPFYSKKQMGRSGTGLGLAIVWNSVQEHDGYIDILTGPMGTTFELYFPETHEAEKKSDNVTFLKGYQGHGEMILVVDDVETQREIFCSMLDYLGYRHKAVSSGEEAIEYLTKNSVDLIILDMIMEPGMSGKETYKEIIKIKPGQRAIIASGFAETEDVKETQRLGAGAFIKKPVIMEKLGIAVREELDKRQAAASA
ncbi:MAG: PAS domain S-box protein [Deltaproteobacteria bacterium]|nr:PAS domain S-box protein [Deltaproteobacteria bacterium]